MRESLRELILLSALSGALLLLCPEGGVKRVLSILCTAALGLTVLPGVEAFSSDLSWESTGQNLLPQQIEEQGTAAEQ